MDQITVAYFAGFFDGEGTVDIRYRRTHGGKYERFELRVQVAQLDVAPLNELVSLWGGSLCKPKTHKVSRWLVAGKQAKAFLSDVFPYLRVKKEEAEVGLKFASLFDVRPTMHIVGKRGFARRTKDRRDSEFSLHQEIRLIREKKGLVAHNRNPIQATCAIPTAA